MTPKPRPGGPTPKITFIVEWTPNEMAHYFMAVANLQAYRHSDNEPLLMPDHPMVALQTEIVDKMIPLIATGVANGWDVKDLITAQNVINQAMQEERYNEDDQ